MIRSHPELEKQGSDEIKAVSEKQLLQQSGGCAHLSKAGGREAGDELPGKSRGRENGDQVAGSGDTVTDEQLSKRISFLSDLGTGEMVEWICVLDKLILKFVKVRTSYSFLPVELIAKYRK